MNYKRGKKAAKRNEKNYWQPSDLREGKPYAPVRRGSIARKKVCKATKGRHENHKLSESPPNSGKYDALCRCGKKMGRYYTCTECGEVKSWQAFGSVFSVFNRGRCMQCVRKPLERVMQRTETTAEIAEFLRQSNAIEDVYDAGSLADAEAAFAFLLKQPKITTNVILDIHRLLMSRHLPAEHAGWLRRVSVWVGWRSCPEAWKVPELLDAWIVRWGAAKIYSAADCRKAHVEFEEIHPFVDGNGRVGRMLFNWHRMQSNLGVCIIRAANRREYYKWFPQSGSRKLG